MSLTASAALGDTCGAAPSDLVGCWPGDGDANDLAGASHGVLLNGTTFAPGQVGQAFSFDGDDDFVSIPDSADLKPPSITVAAWINISQSGQSIAVNKYGGSYNGWILYNNEFDLHRTGGVVVGAQDPSPTPLNTWFHLVGTFDGLTLRLYRDGVEVKSRSWPAGGGYTPTSTPMRIGRPSWFAGPSFPGLVDEVQLYDRALSPSEVAQVYAAGTPASPADRLWWTASSAAKIRRATLDPTGAPEDAITAIGGTQPQPFGLALDEAGGKVYWTVRAIAGGPIQRANLDGSDPETLVTGLTVARSIALDVAAGKMYWTLDFGHKIQRANLDGSNPEDLVTGADFYAGLALDLSAGKMYWTTFDFVRGIHRANLDGSAPQTLISGLGAPVSIALDVAADKMYWTEQIAPTGQDTIHRANLDGTGSEIVVGGLTDPQGLALDLAAGKLYWAEFHDGTIRRANLDGSGPVEDVVTGLALPADVALEFDADLRQPPPNQPPTAVISTSQTRAYSAEVEHGFRGS